MILENGDKIFIVTRRLFEKDLRRHFVGEVHEATDMAVRIKGFAFIYDEQSAIFVRREEVRTRIFSLIDAGCIINVLPRDVVVEDIRYQTNDKNQRTITDGKSFKMNVSEFNIRI